MKSSIQRAVEDVLSQPVGRRNKDARRLRTQAAMIIECAEHGYALAKVSSVAKRVHMSTATLYRDFGDRDTLLLKSLEWAIELFGKNWVSDTAETDPVKRVETLLLAHGVALSDPFMGWIFRLHIHLAHTSAPHLLLLARVARDANLAFWTNEIAQLEAQGFLVPTNQQITVAILLGAIERRTIFSRLAFGENDDREPKLNAVAQHAAAALFQVFGTGAVGLQPRDERLPDQVSACPEKHGLHRRSPVSLLDLPSVRLREYAQRVLSRDIKRLDADGRRIRIQLAAMLECLEYGYEAATLASVAGRAGVSTATFYNDYPDKRAIFIDAILLQARFRVDYQGLIDPSVPVADVIADLVYSIVFVLSDPAFLWFHRVSMASEISNASSLIQSSRDTRAYTETFWFDYLSTLKKAGVLKANDPALTLNMLLGATQRRSVLSMVFFGADDVSEENLQQLSLAATDFVLRLIGVTPPD